MWGSILRVVEIAQAGIPGTTGEAPVCQVLWQSWNAEPANQVLRAIFQNPEMSQVLEWLSSTVAGVRLGLFKGSCTALKAEQELAKIRTDLGKVYNILDTIARPAVFAVLNMPTASPTGTILSEQADVLEALQAASVNPESLIAIQAWQQLEASLQDLEATRRELGVIGSFAIGLMRGAPSTDAAPQPDTEDTASSPS
ncbi:MAG: hypothetical protein LBJ92_02905 [Holosporales bacterium]|nr:hypothetical protein [Holosporales bacterium]